MVIPNFFITFVRHIFHTSHTLHAPLSRETASPCTHPATRHHTPLMAHALPHALSARDCLTRCTSQGLCHTRHTHATHPRPHSTHALRAIPPSQRAMPHAPHTRYASSSSQHTRPPCYHPLARAMPHTRPTRKMLQCFPLQPLLSEKKARAP